MKESVGRRWPHLKSLTKRKENKSRKAKEKGEKIKVKKAKVKKQKKKPKCAKEGYAKRGMVKTPHRIWFLVVWVPQHQKNTFQKKTKVKKETVS